MKDFVHNEDQAFYLNGYQLSGISSLNANYTVPTEDNNFLGYVGPADLLQNAPGTTSFSFKRYMISSDREITDLIGDTGGFDGGISYNNRSFNFQSGFINSYSCAFAVDRIPETSVSLVAYGEVGNNVPIRGQRDLLEKRLFTPTSSGISLKCDGRSTNRVSSFSFNMSVDIEPIYKIGNLFPCEVMTKYPIRQDLSIKFDVDDYETRNLYDYMRTGIHFEDIKITLKEHCAEIQGRKIEYIFKDAHITSMDISTDTSNNTTIDVQYKTVSRYKPTINYEIY